MKKLLQVLVAGVVSVGFMGSVANAAPCDVNVDNSGSGNNTNVECETTHNVNIECKNGVYSATYVVQEGQSGNGTVVGNQSSGSVATGTVANYNNNQVQIGVTGCNTAQTTTTPVTPVTPVTPATPVTPGKGAATPTVKPAELPFTASNEIVAPALIGTAVLASVLAVSRIAIAAYRRAALK